MVLTPTSPVCFDTNDALIRQALTDELNNRKSGKTSRIVQELGVWHGVARIDIALIDSHLHGFEIKSDRDTLDRLLNNQMEVYNAVFDRVTLVVGGHLFIEAFKLIPEWWGLEVARLVRDYLPLL